LSEGMLIIYHTKLHIPIYSGSSAVVMSSDVFVFEGSLKWDQISERMQTGEVFQLYWEFRCFLTYTLYRFIFYHSCWNFLSALKFYSTQVTC